MNINFCDVGCEIYMDAYFSQFTIISVLIAYPNLTHKYMCAGMYILVVHLLYMCVCVHKCVYV